MLEVDGGDGGGQILRTALALSAVTEQSVTITDIRGDRPEPGLKPQHLTAVETLAEICDATVEGASLGSETLAFEPEPPRGGEIAVDIGTAGSVTLLFDAVLPLATTLPAPLSVTVTGGTAVKWSPPLAAHQHVKLPLCRRVGLQAALERERTGFYPAGGGEATLHLAPASLRPMTLTDRGELQGARIYSRESAGLADKEVARRQADAAQSQLEAAAVDVIESVTATAATESPGSALTVCLEFDRTRAGFDALGERGKPAEEVATEAVEGALAFRAGAAAVDRHLADQLLVFLALAGGEIAVPERTAHVETSLDLLSTFGFDVTAGSGGPVTVSAAPPSDAGAE
jgi:RNA 3'-terminal phosphate cyclase (ATP)